MSGGGLNEQQQRALSKSTQTSSLTNQTFENAAFISLVNDKSTKLRKSNDEHKNDLISIEDEIYNLAFRPSRS